jgi:hypothetical protein
MEGKYIQKCAQVAVAQTQKRCSIAEKNLREEIEVGETIYCVIWLFDLERTKKR